MYQTLSNIFCAWRTYQALLQVTYRPMSARETAGTAAFAWERQTTSSTPLSRAGSGQTHLHVKYCDEQSGDVYDTMDLITIEALRTHAAFRSSRSFSFTYGTVEVRARLPKGDWLWPGNHSYAYFVLTH